MISRWWVALALSGAGNDRQSHEKQSLSVHVHTDLDASQQRLTKAVALHSYKVKGSALWACNLVQCQPQ